MAQAGAGTASTDTSRYHLLLADKVWLGRFLGEPLHVEALDQELFHDFEELKRARDETDRRILQWAGTLKDESWQVP